MDSLTIVWQLGQSLSLFGLAAGAVLAFLTDEPYYGRHKNRPNRHVKNTQTAYPRASRRLSFSKGAPIGDLRFRELLETSFPFVVSLSNHNLTQKNQWLTSMPFDKLRASGGFLEVPFRSAACALRALNRRTAQMARQLVIRWQPTPTRTGGDSRCRTQYPQQSSRPKNKQ